MPVNLSDTNIIIDNGITNLTLETVKYEIYTDKKDTVGTTSNISIEPYFESASRMYPPIRSFIANNLTLSSKYIFMIDGGDAHTVFITNDGKVYSYGDNSVGQLGRVVDAANPAATPSQITANIGSLTISAIACGWDYTVFLTNDGKVYSCGESAQGALGRTGTTTTPSIISTLNSFTITAIACGYLHTVFLTNDGKVYSCGYNQFGQLGYGYATSTATPTLITDIERNPNGFINLTISSIACGYSYTVFLTNDGKVYSCGSNEVGQLGYATSANQYGWMTSKTIPSQITTNIGPLTISAIACGYQHTVFLTNDGKVYSCGNNGSGQLGGSHSGATPRLITTTTIGGTPTAFNNLTISAIACGWDYTVFLTNDGKVYSCGSNRYGQLGISTNSGINTANSTPTLITTNIGSLAVYAFACGAYHTLFLTNDGNVYSCGRNNSSQLGISTNSGTDTANPNPTIVPTFPISAFYGSGLYTVSYSSFTASFEPFRCFNDTSSNINNAATWAANNYTSGTGIYNKTLFLESGYNGDWLVIKLPVSIKLKRFDIKQISTALNRAPKNFRLYGSTNGSSWTPLVDKTNTVYENLFYTHTDMTQYPSNTNLYYNHFGLVVNSLLETSETTLSFDEFFIYGAEQLTPLLLNSTNKSLTIPITMLPSYPNSNMNYNLSFPVPTFVNNISTSSNIILQGDYIVNPVSRTSTKIIPNGGQLNIPINSTLTLPTFPTPDITLNYHLLNPLKEGAQWTYSYANTNVYHLGNVGIGTKTPSYPLHINGNMFVSSTAYTGSGQTSWTTISDRRIKDNIVKASYEKCFDNVKNIELYRFNFKDNAVNTNDTNQLGFIAQEVQNVYPKAVEVNKIKDKNGVIPDLLSLNTTQIKYTLYGAFKHLINKVEILEEKLKEIDNSNIT